MKSVATLCRPSPIDQGGQNVVYNKSISNLEIINRLVYTEAVIWETLRMACIDPFTLMHYASKETKLCGYTIPQVG